MRFTRYEDRVVEVEFAARQAGYLFLSETYYPGWEAELDGRPAVWSKDSGAHFDQALIAELARAAGRAGTELQYAVYSAAASDATGVLTRPMVILAG